MQFNFVLQKKSNQKKWNCSKMTQNEKKRNRERKGCEMIDRFDIKQ